MAGDIAQTDFDRLWHSEARALAKELRAMGLDWLVTDFITLGSPLAHASLLLARGPADLARRKEERELPAAPPFREDGKHFSYERTWRSADGKRQVARVPDHAALFALTAWTNLYFPCRALFLGDLVGGALGDAFGGGVANYRVSTGVWHGWLAHTHYWTRYEDFEAHWNSAPLRLIAALDLQRRSFPRRRKPVAASQPLGNSNTPASPATPG